MQVYARHELNERFTVKMLISLGLLDRHFQFIHRSVTQSIKRSITSVRRARIIDFGKVKTTEALIEVPSDSRHSEEAPVFPADA